MVDNNGPLPVLVASVRAEDVPVVITALGTVTPTQQVTVRPRVDGLLQTVNFTEGILVHAGDSLAQIDSRPFAAALATARGELLKDQAQLDTAQKDLQRYRKLLGQDSISRQEVETQESLVKQLQGTVASDEGTVATAELNLSFTTITTPTSGIAGLRQIDPGNMVYASDTTGLVVLTAVQPIDVVLSVPEEQLTQVLQQQHAAATPLTVAVSGRDADQRLAQGALLAIDNQIDAATGSTKLKARFANGDNTLFPGQFVNVQLVLQTLPEVATVMQSAVQQSPDGPFVYVVTREQRVEVRPVQPGPTIKERVAILQGLAPGETVVIDGTDKLVNGARVTAVDKRQQASASDPAKTKAPTPAPAP